MRLLIFGDSIAYGDWDSAGGWVDRLKRENNSSFLENGGVTKTQAVNLGVGGDTTSKLLVRMKNEIDARISASWPLAIFIAIGINDSRTISGKPEATIDKFQANLGKLIEIAKNYTTRIVLLGTTPLPKSQVEFKDYLYDDERLKLYDAEIKKIAAVEKVDYLPLRPAFEKAGVESLFCFDSLHPNDNGHMIIAELAARELDKLRDESA